VSKGLKQRTNAEDGRAEHNSVLSTQAISSLTSKQGADQAAERERRHDPSFHAGRQHLLATLYDGVHIFDETGHFNDTTSIK
jgi:hypothetical protein